MPSPRNTASSFLASALTILAVSWAAGLGSSLGLQLYDEQYAAAILAISLALVFIKPSRRSADSPWLLATDGACALAALGAVGYLAWNYPELVDLVLLRPLDGVIAASITIALVIYGLRRAAGDVLVGLVILFLIYAVGADLLPASLEGRATDWQKLAGYLAVDVNGILGVPLKIGASIVVPFILFGVLLSATGAANWFTDFSLTLMGGFRGGAAKIAILASALFGSISGSAVANVVATGVVTIPLIKRSGYAARHAAAIEAVASTGGQLMPPVMGASAFLMAEFLQIPYSEVVMAALAPAILYYVAVFIQVDLDAAKLGLKPVPKELIPSARQVARGAFYLLPFVVLIALLFFYNFSPASAALWSSLSLLILAWVMAPANAKPKLSMVADSIRETGLAVVDIVLITAAAGIVIGVLGISGLGFNLTMALISIGGGNLLLLLVLSSLVCIVLGMGLPTVGVYVLLATLVSPALVKVGVEPKAAHLFVMYFGMMSMITPPVAIAAFAAAGIAGSNAMETGLSSMRMGWSAYIVPILFVFSPTLLLIGTPGAIVQALVSAVLGIWWVSMALVGYGFSRLAPLMRLGFGVAGLLALIPADAIAYGYLTDWAGLLGGLACTLAHGLTGRTVQVKVSAHPADQK
jgi:TRAP transporter 4TM/12TM fusion protein